MTHLIGTTGCRCGRFTVLAVACLALALPACAALDGLRYENLQGEPFTGVNAELGHDLRPRANSGRSMAVTAKGREIDRDFGYH